MKIRERLRTLACCMILQLAATIGLPMRPEQVLDLMRVLNQPKVARTNPQDDEIAGPKRRGELPKRARNATV